MEEREVADEEVTADEYEVEFADVGLEILREVRRKNFTCKANRLTEVESLAAMFVPKFPF